MGYKFPDLSKPDTLERRYAGKMSKQALQFLDGVLKLDPRERLTARDALFHPFFDGLRSPEEEQAC